MHFCPLIKPASIISAWFPYHLLHAKAATGTKIVDNFKLDKFLLAGQFYFVQTAVHHLEEKL